MIPHMQWANMEEVDISRQKEDHTMSIVTSAPTYKHPDELIRQYHGGRVGHFGARDTWKALNKNHPGHRILY